ncbi:hypothetical protein L6452_40364 [Arctium lappa]|uniref:Uncharacterized protein n=1 Tax=Arctium lappa TaxID=4217 RepID=A0ACB8XMV6_ARCLA|nr:hypothetical protein L6452_40364 [Arctium lappa]
MVGYCSGNLKCSAFEDQSLVVGKVLIQVIDSKPIEETLEIKYKTCTFKVRVSEDTKEILEMRLVETSEYDSDGESNKLEEGLGSGGFDEEEWGDTSAKNDIMAENFSRLPTSVVPKENVNSIDNPTTNGHYSEHRASSPQKLLFEDNTQIKNRKTNTKGKGVNLERFGLQKGKLSMRVLKEMDMGKYGSKSLANDGYGPLKLTGQNGSTSISVSSGGASSRNHVLDSLSAHDSEKPDEVGVQISFFLRDKKGGGGGGVLYNNQVVMPTLSLSNIFVYTMALERTMSKELNRFILRKRSMSTLRKQIRIGRAILPLPRKSGVGSTTGGASDQIG